MKKKITSLVLTAVLAQTQLCFAQTSDTFNLAGVIENIINYQNKNEFVSDVRTDSKESFINASTNMYNGNVVVAYSEFLKTIDSLDRNFALLMLTKKLYEYGFFSLGDISLSKISGRDKMQNQIQKLKASYSPSFPLTKDEENYLAKAYTSIYYNNSPEEVAFNLIKKTALLENSDYANFIMAMSMFECRQYNQALIYVDKAIEKNNVNSNYKCFKLKALNSSGKYKEALKYAKENEDKISVFLQNDFKILKQQTLQNLASDDLDKKFYQIYSYYLSGNYYKVLKETQNILNFSKNSPKIITLQGMAHLALGDIQSAKEDFESSYKLNKKFELTNLGLADIEFINKNYKESYNIYKKYFNSDYKNEAILKAYISLSLADENDKKLVKLDKTKQAFEENAFFEYYLVANNLFVDELNKKKYTAKSLGINLLNLDTWDILLAMDSKNNNFDEMEKIIFILLFSDNLNADYYYYSALTLNNSDNKKEAFYELKKALNLNPDYKPAIELMNKLQNELI